MVITDYFDDVESLTENYNKFNERFSYTNINNSISPLHHKFIRNAIWNYFTTQARAKN